MNMSERVANRHLQRRAGGVWVVTHAANRLEDLSEELREVVDLLEGSPELINTFGEIARVVNKLRRETSKDLHEAARTLHGMRPKLRGKVGDHPQVSGGGQRMTAALSNKMDNQTKRRVLIAFKKRGLDGNGRFDKAAHGYAVALDVLSDFGIELDEVVNSHHFLRPEGRLAVNIAFTNPEDSFSPISIQNSMLVLSWHRFDETGKYEVLAYLS